MPNSKHTTTSTKDSAARRPSEDPKELTRDIVDYLTEYARDNPGHAALFCLGVGFVLGWKLKPW
jgi:hypothetical protein